MHEEDKREVYLACRANIRGEPLSPREAAAIFIMWAKDELLFWHIVEEAQAAEYASQVDDDG